MCFVVCEGSILTTDTRIVGGSPAKIEETKFQVFFLNFFINLLCDLEWSFEVFP